MRRMLRSWKILPDEGYFKYQGKHWPWYKVLTSPEYETLRTKLFGALANHAQTVEVWMMPMTAGKRRSGG